MTFVNTTVIGIAIKKFRDKIGFELIQFIFPTVLFKKKQFKLYNGINFKIHASFTRI